MRKTKQRRGGAVKYTISGKEYSEFDINKQCAELHLGYYEEGVRFVSTGAIDHEGHIERFPYKRVTGNKKHWKPFEPCIDPASCWPIIEKCWGKLMLTHVDEGDYTSKWEYLVYKHNCSKLIAACICFIEMNR